MLHNIPVDRSYSLCLKMTSSKLFSLLLLIIFFFEVTYTCKPCECQNLAWTEADLVSMYSANCFYGSVKIQVNKIPDTLDTSIAAIDMTDQLLTYLDGNELARYKNVKYLKFYCNQIKHVDRDAFQDTKDLTYLNFFNNSIKELPTGIFSKTLKLTKFWLDSNKLEALQDHLFENLPQLKEIDLKNNKIKSIESRCFTNLPALEIVDLSSNFLETLYLDFYDSLPNLKFLYLEKNPWVCDENLCNLINFVTPRRLWNNRTIPTCNDRREKRWDQLKLEDFSPSIVSNKKSISEGENLFIQCRYCFVSNITWNFNKLRISDIFYEVDDKSITSTIFIDNIRKADSGHYMCHVENCRRCQNASVYVNVLDKMTTAPNYLDFSTEISFGDYNFEDDVSSASSSNNCCMLLVLTKILLQIYMCLFQMDL